VNGVYNYGPRFWVGYIFGFGVLYLVVVMCDVLRYVGLAERFLVEGGAYW